MSPRKQTTQKITTRCPYCPAILSSSELTQHIQTIHRDRASKKRVHPSAPLHINVPLLSSTEKVPLLQCGALQLTTVGEQRKLAPQQTINGVRIAGQATIFIANDQQGTQVEIAYVVWDNQEREVRTLTVASPHQALRLLEGGRRRLGIRQYASDPNKCVIDLSQARIESSGDQVWPRLLLATKAELNEGADLDASAILLKLGAWEIDTRAKLLQDQSSRRNYICAIYPAEQILVPVVAFLLTRILPLQRGMKRTRS